jgi:hypothetical protein
MARLHLQLRITRKLPLASPFFTGAATMQKKYRFPQLFVIVAAGWLQNAEARQGMDDSHHARRLVFKNIAAEADSLPRRIFDPLSLTPPKAVAAGPNGWIVVAVAVIALAVSGAALFTATQGRADHDRIDGLTASLQADAAQISTLRSEVSAIATETRTPAVTAAAPLRSVAPARHRLRAVSPPPVVAEPAPQAAVASSTALAPGGLSR